MKSLSRHMRWQSKRFYCKGASGQSTAGTALPYLRVYSNRVSFPGCLWPVFLLVPGGACISEKMSFSFRVSGGLTGHIRSWRLSILLAPPKFSQFSTAALWFLIRISRCEAAHASSYYCTWPRQVFLGVNCSLISWILITNGLLSSRGENISIWNDTCDKGTWDRI